MQQTLQENVTFSTKIIAFKRFPRRQMAFSGVDSYNQHTRLASPSPETCLDMKKVYIPSLPERIAVNAITLPNSMALFVSENQSYPGGATVVVVDVVVR